MFQKYFRNSFIDEGHKQNIKINRDFLINLKVEKHFPALTVIDNVVLFQLKIWQVDILIMMS